jgi:hypothetical protein
LIGSFSDSQIDSILLTYSTNKLINQSTITLKWQVQVDLNGWYRNENPTRIESLFHNQVAEKPKK